MPELARRVATRIGADAVLLTETLLLDISDRVERPTLEEWQQFDAFEFIDT